MKACYHSKVILFGEYSMIFDATALMIPLKRFAARWKLSEANTAAARRSNANIARYRDYLCADEQLRALIDTEAMRKDLNMGIHLYSTIPTGYGLGSSGALVAAVYDRYAKHPIDDNMALKELFGQMESYFHGSSSGIDPLQCYLGQPFRISAAGVEPIDDAFLKGDIHICLIDTKIKSDTRPLVQQFKAQREDSQFLHAFQQEYVPHVATCIRHLTESNGDAFFASLKQLGQAQMRFLRAMITDNTLPLFQQDRDFHFGVKISGSGGGGYLLGFTDDVEKATELLRDFELIWI